MARRIRAAARRRTGREEQQVVLLPYQPIRDTSPAADVLESIDEVLEEQ